MIDMTKFRQKVERRLFLLVLILTAILIGIRMCLYVGYGLERHIINRMLLSRRGFNEAGMNGVSFEMTKYLDHARKFVDNITIESESQRFEMFGMEQREAVLCLYSLIQALLDPQMVIRSISYGLHDSVVMSRAINRLVGKGLSDFHEEYDFWANTEYCRYLLDFRPPGFDGTKLEIVMECSKKTVDLNRHVVVVILQYLDDHSKAKTL